MAVGTISTVSSKYISPVAQYALEWLNERRDRRPRPPNEVSAMMVAVSEEYQRLSNHIRSLAAMQARSGSTLLNIGVGTHLHSHNNGGLPDCLTETLNRWINGDRPRLSVNSGVAPLPNIRSIRDVQEYAPNTGSEAFAYDCRG